MTAPYSVPVDEVTTAVQRLVETLDRPTYDAVYAGDPLTPIYPYYIVFQVPGGNPDPIPTLDLDLRSSTLAFQVTAVSDLRNQAQNAGRRAHDLFFARDDSGWLHDLVLPDGWQCLQRIPGQPAGVIRTGEHPAAVFSQPVPFQLTLAPV